MDNLIVHSLPELREPTLVAAFAGWPDAGEIATGAVRYLVEKLGATTFAELRPEEFYIFTEVRPQTSLGKSAWERHITWPANQFSWWKRETPGDLIFFLGIEPNLKWATFVGCILDLAQRLGVARVISLGGTLDGVPHTKEPPISGSASEVSVRESLEVLSVYPSDYEGPTSIHSALIDACNRRGIPNLSLWGHAPLYLQATPNPRVCLALLRRLVRVLDLTVDLGELEETATAFDQRVDQAVSSSSELQEYVRRLEAAYESRERASREMPSPEAIVRDLEEYLRKRRQQRRNGGSQPGGEEP
jgi:proteasome assembly chaperone (PAC2) family protein